MSATTNGNRAEHTITAERANGRVPAWLEKLGITGQGDSTYFLDTKPRAKRAMRSKYFSPAARVHICLGLHTLGFQSDLAVKMEAGKRIPIGTSDIANETGLHRQNVRPALMELAEEGLAEIKGSTKGHVEIYAWPVPKAPEKVADCNSRHYNPGDVPPQVLSFLQKFRIRLPQDFVMSREYVETVEAAARDYQNAEIVLKRALKGNPATECINKEERNERNIERNGSSSSSEVLGTTLPKAEEEEDTLDSASPLPEPPSEPTPEPPDSALSASEPVEKPELPARLPAQPVVETPYHLLKKLYPKERFDEPKTKPVFQALNAAEQKNCIERLLVYLKCPRWLDKNGRWIPLSSTWIKTYADDPPPLIRKRSGLEEQAESINETARFVEELNRKYPRR